jgi:tetratricopeptide (TPR) repeat protein
LRDVDNRGTPRARAAVYWNASLVAEAADDVSTAVLLAERALALYSDGDDERSLARLRVAYGWLLLRTSPPQPDKARDMLRTAHASLGDVGTATDLAYCETELARAALLLGDPEGALEHAARAQGQLSDEARLESAYVRLVRGAALLALGRHDEAVADYRRASSILGSLDQARMAAGAWRELADAFTRLDLLQDAALAYQQALTEMGVRGAPQRTGAGAPAQTEGAQTRSG